MGKKQKVIIIKCPCCKRKTKHKRKGFLFYNRRYECLDCKTEEDDELNERW